MIKIDNNIKLEFDVIFDNTLLVDITFNKYIDDNINRISNYEMYKQESWMALLNSYEINDVLNKNDPSDI
jgi:hypothetical protein